MSAIYDSTHLGAAITAIGGLGTAAAGVVDLFKTLPGGGISHVGFAFIKGSIAPFVDDVAGQSSSGGTHRLLDTLHGNWINGTPLVDQKAIAKSLIKLRLTAENAEAFVKALGTDVDETKLAAVANKMNNGAKLEPEETNALGRFDLALTALLDDAYQHADQRYRNAAKLAATCVSVGLAVAGGVSLTGIGPELWQWLIAGLLATPLAPMAKDLASALAAGANVAQSLRK